MSAIIKRLEDKINLLYPVIALVLFVLMLSVINGNSIGVEKMKQVSNGVGILDLEPGYTVGKAYSMLESQGEPGRSYYLTKIIPLDFVFPFTYMLFYCTLILYLLKKLHPKSGVLHYAAIVPIFAMLFDYFENLCVIQLLIHFPDKLIAAAKTANVFTILKNALINISMAILLVLIAANLIVWIRAKTTKAK